MFMVAIENDVDLVSVKATNHINSRALSRLVDLTHSQEREISPRALAQCHLLYRRVGGWLYQQAVGKLPYALVVRRHTWRVLHAAMGSATTQPNRI